MSRKIYISNSENETMKYASLILSSNKDIDLIILKGNYGAGKTIFAKGVAKFLNVEENIKSPSFNTKFIYDGLSHYDLYNVKVENFKNTIFEIMDDLSNSKVVIEWGDKFGEKLINKYFDKYLLIEMQILDNKKRKILVNIIK